jgi:hypothetical protein
MSGDRDDLDDTDAPTQADIDRVSAAVRASAPATGEPDWAQLSASIGAAVDGEARRQRRTRAVLLGGVVLAAAAVAALLVWPGARGTTSTARQTGLHDAATIAPQDGAHDRARQDEIATMEAELARHGESLEADDVAVPDDLGGITVDEELVDEAAAALDDDLGDDDAFDDRLLPDGTWIDELSDDELERAVEILDGEAG